MKLEVFAAVECGDTIFEFAMKLDHSESYRSRAVPALAETGLVDAERDGWRNRVVPSAVRAVEVYQDFVHQHAHIKFAELLTGNTLEVLYYLDQPRTVAEQIDNYRTTANRIHTNARPLSRRHGRWALPLQRRLRGLHEFTRELAHHRHRHSREPVARNRTLL